MAAVEVADRDVLALLDVVDVGVQSPPARGRLPLEVLLALADLVPCDGVSFVDMDPVSRTLFVADGALCREPTVSPGAVTVPDLPFFEEYWKTEKVSYPSRTGDDRTVTLRSDFCSDREWRRTSMYAVNSEPGTTDYSMMCSLPSSGSRVRRVMLFRNEGPDFTTRERQLMTLLRPHLQEIYARWPSPVEVPLTPRQLQLMELVAEGWTNGQIARRLCLSEHTVRKHLENVFQRLGVSSRAAAVARLYREG